MTQEGTTMLPLPQDWTYRKNCRNTGNNLKQAESKPQDYKKKFRNNTMRKILMALDEEEEEEGQESKNDNKEDKKKEGKEEKDKQDFQ